MAERMRAIVTQSMTAKAVGMGEIMKAVDKSDPRSVAVYLEGRCPSCGGHMFNLGPVGGLAENIRCAACGAKWNVGAPFPPQPIDNTDACYDLTREIDLRDYFKPESSDPFGENSVTFKGVEFGKREGS